MFDILHRVGIKAPLADVHAALTHPDRLAGWWTTDTSGEGQPGGALAFKFGERGFVDVKVLAAQSDRILWEVTGGPPEWIGSRIVWAPEVSGDWTVVMFSHTGWREPIEFMHHCSTKWALFLMSLKSLLETGEGQPWPQEVSLGDWD